MATIKDIAKKLNVAASTVSMALNDSPEIGAETKRLVAKTALEMNYVKNGSALDLQRKKTNTVLLIIEDASRVYFSNFINGIQQYLMEYSYDLLIATTYRGNTATAHRFISEHRADGAIIFTKLIQDEYLERYACKKFPMVSINRNLSGEYYTSVISDSEHGAYLLTNYLIGLGKKEIMFVKGTDLSIGSETRFKGYSQAMKDRGLEDYVRFFDAHESTIKSGSDAAKKIFAEGIRGDAVFFSNDDMAIGGISALKEMGYSVPKDMSVVGFNDSPLGDFISPKLTTISDNQRDGLARLAVEKLMGYLNHSEKNIPISYVDTFLVERDSAR